MKKIIFTAFLLIIICSIQAQKLGVKAGVTFSHFKYQAKSFFWTNPEWQNSSKRTGYTLGVYFEQELATIKMNKAQKPYFAFETGLFASQAGGNRTWNNNTVEYETSLTYLELPCLGKLKYRIYNVNLQLKAGTYLSIGMGGKETRINSSGESTEDINWSHNHGYYNKYDYGLIAGAGINYRNFGINALYKSGLGNTWEYTICRNKVFEISVSYSIINLKRKQNHE